jgi:hypothetical protein
MVFLATPDYSQYKTTAPESVETVTTIDRIIEQVKTHYPKAYSFGLDLEDHAEADHKHDNLSVRIKEKEFTYGESSLMILMNIQENFCSTVHTG